MPSYEFDHVHLISPNPQETAKFYEQMFGAKQISVQEHGNGMVLIRLDFNGTTILISSPHTADSPIGLEHFGIRTDNLDKAAEELKAAGVNFTLEPRQIHPGLKISYFLAPDDVTVELQEGSA